MLNVEVTLINHFILEAELVIRQIYLTVKALVRLECQIFPIRVICGHHNGVLFALNILIQNRDPTDSEHRALRTRILWPNFAETLEWPGAMLLRVCINNSKRVTWWHCAAVRPVGKRTLATAFALITSAGKEGFRRGARLTFRGRLRGLLRTRM